MDGKRLSPLRFHQSGSLLAAASTPKFHAGARAKSHDSRWFMPNTRKSIFGGREILSSPPWKTGSSRPARCGEAGDGVLPQLLPHGCAEDSRLLRLRFFFL